MKKRSKRGLKEGDKGYLQSASESDSAMEDSGDESASEDESLGSELTDIKDAIESLTTDSNENGLKWLKTCFDDEKEDREGDSEDAEDVPILPMTEDCILAMERSSFTNFLRLLQLVPPNDQVLLLR